jgi:transcriptional regulator with XRE-family HTH domain
MSTPKTTPVDTLETDIRHVPDDDQGMALYLKQWREFRGLSPADLARSLGVHRSYVSKWETGERALKDVNRINKICEVLDISQEQLSKMPPKTSPDEVMISSAARSKPIPSDSESEPTEGIKMVNDKIAAITIIGNLPDELASTARKLLESLEQAGAAKRRNPTRRGGTED